MRSTEIGQAFRTIQNIPAAGGKKRDGQSALARALRVSIGAGGQDDATQPDCGESPGSMRV